jgi:hypothetical protein
MLPYIAIERFGLRLQQIRDEDSEIVREGRNKPFVRTNHFYEGIITPEQHRNWYEGICKTRDYYLVASKDTVPLGLLYLKDITPGIRSGHIGVFFWEEKILRTRIPILAIITFLDFFLITAGVANIDCIIRMDNGAMDHIVQFLEFDLRYNAPTNELRANLTKERMLENRVRLLKYAERLNPDPASWHLRIEGEKDPRHHHEILRVLP